MKTHRKLLKEATTRGQNHGALFRMSNGALGTVHGFWKAAASRGFTGTESCIADRLYKGERDFARLIRPPKDVSVAVAGNKLKRAAEKEEVAQAMAAVAERKNQLSVCSSTKGIEMASLTLANGWKVGIEEVTPTIAAQMLQRNVGNRNIKKGVQARYAAAMRGGSWITTPEALIFDTSGNLCNGQHRLNAIIESGVTLKLMTVRNVGRDVFSALDRGTRRSVSDALGIDPKLAEVARLGVIICRRNTGLANTQVLDSEVQTVADIFAETHAELREHSRKVAKYFSSAPFRLAASLRMIVDKDQDYVLQVYNDLNHSRVSALPPIAQSLAGALLAGRLDSREPIDRLCRAWVALDKSKAKQSRIQISDPLEMSYTIGDLFNPFQ